MRLSSISLQTVFNHEFQLRFNKESWCVQEMYWYFLYKRKYETPNCQKAVVRVNDKLDDKEVISCLSDVAVIEKRFDFEKHFSSSEFERKIYMLDTLHKGLLTLADKYEWKMSDLDAAYHYCRDNKLINEWMLKDKFIKSPSKDYQGGVQVQWDLKSITATGIILDKKGNELVRNEFFVKEPHKGEFVYYSKISWEDQNTFTLSTKNGADKWSMKIPH
jgi:hypothetical protein